MHLRRTASSLLLHYTLQEPRRGLSTTAGDLDVLAASRRGSGATTTSHAYDSVAQARFREGTNDWRGTNVSGRNIDSEVVIFAVGQLHKANYPKLSGFEDFNGSALHPAERDPGIDFHGKRIGIVGTRSSAAQISPALALFVSNITVFTSGINTVCF